MGLWTSIKEALAERPPQAAAGDWDGWPTGEGPFDFEDEDGVGFHVSSDLGALLADPNTSEARAYERDPAIRICVDFLATNIAHTKLKARDRVSTEERVEVDYDHRLARMLREPNPAMSGFDLILGLVSDLALYDDAYWLLGLSRSRDRIYRIPPTLIEAKGGSVIEGVGHYDLKRPDGQKVQELSPERIVHFHWYSPTDTRVGVTRLRALRSTLNEERQASRHRAWYWRNAGRFEGILERPKEAGPWTDERRKRFREDWSSRYTGHRNAGIPQVAEDGMKWVQAGFSPRDSEFIAGREWALELAATTYQIPLAMLSRSDSQAYASMREYHKVLYTDVLGPWNAMIEGTINRQLVPLVQSPDENLYVEFNIDEKLQGDFEEQSNAARSSVQVPWLAVDDMRRKRGEAPLGPPFDKPARPTNYTFGDEPPEEEAQGPTNVVSIDQAALLEGERDG